MGRNGYYPYGPSKAGATIAMLLFGGSAFYHLWQLIKLRSWFFIAFLVGAFMMTLGYIFRLISSRDQNNLAAYICQSMFIILPPSLYAATIYMIYSRIVMFVGKPQFSIVAPRKITKIFVMGDTTAFLLQLSGGGMQTIDSMRTLGQKILLVGLFVQLVFFGFFLYVSVNFSVRVHRSGLGLIEGSWRRLLHILFLVSMLIIVRCIFRIIEYIGGADSYVYLHEVFMYMFDAIPMFIVQAIFHVYHPGNILVGQKLPNDSCVSLQTL